MALPNAGEGYNTFVQGLNTASDLTGGEQLAVVKSGNSRVIDINSILVVVNEQAKASFVQLPNNDVILPPQSFYVRAYQIKQSNPGRRVAIPIYAPTGVPLRFYNVDTTQSFTLWSAKFVSNVPSFDTALGIIPPGGAVDVVISLASNQARVYDVKYVSAPNAIQFVSASGALVNPSPRRIVFNSATDITVQLAPGNELSSVPAGILNTFHNQNVGTVTLQDATGAFLGTIDFSESGTWQYCDNTTVGGSAFLNFDTLLNGVQGNITSVTSAFISDFNAKVATTALTQGKHAWILPMGSFRPALTSPCGTLQQESASGNNFTVFTFAQAGLNYVGARLPMPKSWNKGTLTFKLDWKTTATTGNVVWYLQAIVRRNGDAENVAFGTAVSITSAAASGALSTIITAETSALTPAGTAANDCILELRIYRNGGSGSDNLAALAMLEAVTMFITLNAGNDA